MLLHHWKLIVSATFLLAAAISPQQSAPTFEVVSIRVVPPNTPPTLRSQDFTPVLPGGQYISLARLIVFFFF